MKIKPALSRDARDILDLQKLAYRSEAEIYDDYSIPPFTQTIAEIAAEMEKMTFFKAETNKTLIGSVRGRMREKTAEIGRLIVHPDYQDRGVGTKLMRAIEKVSVEPCGSSCSPAIKATEISHFTGH